MSRRLNFISFFAICALLLFLLYANNTFSSSTTNYDYYKNKEHKDHYQYFKSNRHYNMKIASGGPSSSQNLSVGIEEILNRQRERIREEMYYFEYPGGRFNVDAEKLSDLTPETGGKPYRSVIITTWRSGSTFLGDIINSMPANYYHYEPLLNFDIIQIRGPPHAKKAIQNLKQLLMCNYTNMEDYLEYGQGHVYLFAHNARLWNQCKLYPQYCWEPKFLEPFCKLFPLQSMKVVRLRLLLAEQLLEDEKLNVRIILLVRDPRGTIQSRKHRVWCPGRPDCDNPQNMCNDMVADYNAAVGLIKKYPQRLRVIRYEDLSLNPYEMGEDILQFYGLPFDPSVEEFLQSHTKTNIGDFSSTFRDSKSAPFHWIKELTPREVETIENSCTEAMSLWGYKKSDNDTLDSTFNPILPFTFS